MSGAGRKSHYRKGVTSDYSHGLPLPDPTTNDTVCRVTNSRGSNMFEVEVPAAATGDGGLASGVFQLSPRSDGAVQPQQPSSPPSSAGHEKRTTTCLARMPNKFKKLIWIKRNDYLIITKDVEKDAGSTIASTTATNSNMEVYDIKYILNPAQIRHIKANNLWPEALVAQQVDPLPATAQVAAAPAGQSHNPNHKIGSSSNVGSASSGRRAVGYSADDIMPAYDDSHADDDCEGDEDGGGEEGTL